MEQINFEVKASQVAQTTFYSSILWRRRMDGLNLAINAMLKMRPVKVFLGRDLNEEHNRILNQQAADGTAKYWEAVSRSDSFGEPVNTTEEILIQLANKFEHMTSAKPQLQASKDTPATVKALAKLKGLSFEEAAAQLDSGYETKKQTDVAKLEEKMQSILTMIETRTHEGVIKVESEEDEDGNIFERTSDNYTEWSVPFQWIEKAYETALNNALRDPWAERREGTIMLIEADFKALKGSRCSSEHTNEQIDAGMISSAEMAQGSQAGK